jgi:hypothetical protein
MFIIMKKNHARMLTFLVTLLMAFGVFLYMPAESFAASNNVITYNISSFGDSYYYYGKANSSFYNDAFDMMELTDWTYAKTAIGFGAPSSGAGLSLATTIAAGSASNQRGYPLYYPWTYFKKSFELDERFNKSAVTKAVGTHRIDDALVIFINGIEIYRFNTSSNDANVNIGAVINWGAYAGHNTDATDRDFIINSDYSSRYSGYMGLSSQLFDAGSLTNLRNALRSGTNVITCVVGQRSSDSSDLWFDLSLKIECGANYPIELFEAEMLALTPGPNERALNFTWYSDRINSADSVVQIAKKSQMTGGQFPATYAIIKEGTAGNASSNKSWHKVSITGLDENTSYIYRVSHDKNIYSKIYEFKTGAAGSFQFIAVADAQLSTGNQDSGSLWPKPVTTTKAGWANTVNEFTTMFPEARFIMSLGDQVDTVSTNEPEYANLLAPEALHSIPLAPVMGNHDRQNNFDWHYNLPNATPNGAGATLSGVDVYSNYWYRYNDALFVALNTSPSTTTTTVSNYVEQFDATLKAAVEANPNAKWLFVQHHKSTASPGSHQSDADVKIWATELETLMDKYHVDFVLAGHDHVYSRSWSIYSHKKVEGIDYGAASATNPQGTIYYTLNTSSGLKYYSIPTVKPSGAPEWVNGKPWYTNIGMQIKVPQFTTVDVSVGSVTFKTYRVDTMDILDQYTVYKIAEQTPTVNHLSYSIPANHIYNGSSQGIGAVTAKDGVTGLGAITVKYNGSTTLPVNAGTYAVTADIAAGSNYSAALGLSLGSYTIAPPSPPVIELLSVKNANFANKDAPKNYNIQVSSAGTVMISLNAAKNDSYTVSFKYNGTTLATAKSSNGVATINYAVVNTGAYVVVLEKISNGSSTFSLNVQMI